LVLRLVVVFTIVTFIVGLACLVLGYFILHPWLERKRSKQLGF